MSTEMDIGLRHQYTVFFAVFFNLFFIRLAQALLICNLWDDVSELETLEISFLCALKHIHQFWNMN